MSSPAPSRCSRAARPAWTTMNRLTFASRASAVSCWCTAAGRSTPTLPAIRLGVCGLGRSAGSAISSGSPDSVSYQWLSCRAIGDSGSPSSPSTSRCQTV